MMNDDLHQIALAAKRLADRLPYAVVISMAEAVTQHGGMDWQTGRTAILNSLPTADFRDAAADFVDHWWSKAARLTPQSVAVALVVAANAEIAHRQEESTEIVWTGPETSDTKFRQTEQAIFEVLSSATKRLTVVSYAVYRIPRIKEALVAAANRGVNIRIIVETPNRTEGQDEYDCLLALGDRVASVSSIYYWPQEERGKDENGKVGILHVKCAVADGHRLFLSSANFTEYAFTINMELGLLITGGKLPEQIEKHFERLIDTGCLVSISRCDTGKRTGVGI
jgi:phosphatidylserine/phosphatidylglycerophosphate/cardiolipin synthase-like enzyme